jgi:hypothetical protein
MTGGAGHSVRAAVPPRGRWSESSRRSCPNRPEAVGWLTATDGFGADWPARRKVTLESDPSQDAGDR